MIPSRPTKGAYRDRHETRAGMRWTRPRRARGMSQGGLLRKDRERRPRAARTGADSVFAWLRGRAHASRRKSGEDVRGRRSRVVLAPEAGVKSRGASIPTGNGPPTNPRGDGGNRARLTGESTKETVKTIRAGKAGRFRLNLWSTPCASSAHGPRVPAGARPSPRPLQRGRGLSANLGQNMPREYEIASVVGNPLSMLDLVIARSDSDEAIQNLAAERFWIASLRSQ